MKTSKIIRLTGIVFSLSLFIISCQKNQNATPTATNTFVVNLDNAIVSVPDTSIEVDGDSISFLTRSTYGPFAGTHTDLTIVTNSSHFEYLNVEAYPYNINTNMRDSSVDPSLQTNVNAIDSGITINDSYTT